MSESHKLQIVMSRAFLVEGLQLIYNRWATEFDALKAVKSEKDDGSKDWNEFHAERLRRQTEQEAVWRALKDEGLAIMRSGVMEEYDAKQRRG